MGWGGTTFQYTLEPRPACEGWGGGGKGTYFSRQREGSNMRLCLVSSNDIKITENKRQRKEVGTQFTILNTAGYS